MWRGVEAEWREWTVQYDYEYRYLEFGYWYSTTHGWWAWVGIRAHLRGLLPTHTHFNVHFNVYGCYAYGITLEKVDLKHE